MKLLQLSKRIWKKNKKKHSNKSSTVTTVNELGQENNLAFLPRWFRGPNLDVWARIFYFPLRICSRFFSTAEYAYSELRQNLLPQNLEMQLFLKINKKFCDNELLSKVVADNWCLLFAINCNLISGCIN